MGLRPIFLALAVLFLFFFLEFGLFSSLRFLFVITELGLAFLVLLCDDRLARFKPLRGRCFYRTYLFSSSPSLQGVIFDWEVRSRDLPFCRVVRACFIDATVAAPLGRFLLTTLC